MMDIRKKFWENSQILKSFETRATSEYITNVLDDFIKKDPEIKVLDIGCGAGRYTRYLHKAKVSVIGLDRHLDMARSLIRENIPFVKADMDAIPFLNNTFNLILSVGVLHNALSFEEFRRSVFEISRLLVKNGYCLCSIFTSDIISNDLKMIEKNLFLILNDLPMLLLSKEQIDDVFFENNLSKVRIVNEHVTDVGTGNRYVYTVLFQKQ